MNETRLPASAERDSEASHAMLDRLQQIIELAAVVLPVQGPLNVFIAQNKLQAFEKYPFDEGLRRAAATMGCHPYLSEERYREELRRARIRFSDLQEVLERDLGPKGTELIADRLTRYDLRLAMLEYPAKIAPTAELLWYIAETNALTRIRGDAPATLREQLIGETRRWVMRDLRSWNDNGNKQEPKWRVGNGLGELLERLGDSAIENWNDDRWEEFSLRALWRICIDGVSDLPPFTIPQLPTVRHRDLLAEATGQDSDRLVNEVLIRFCSAFLDQGLARWPLPNRDQGMYKAFCSLYGEGSAAPTRWMRGLSQELTRLSKNHVSPRESIRESLEILGIEEDEHEAFLSATLLALRGWAGMIWYVENRQDSAVKPVPKGSLVEFVAVRLLLDRFALKSLAAETIDYHGELSNLRSEARGKIVTQWPPTDEQRGFLVFQYAQILGLSPEILFGFDRDRWASLMSEIETFSSMERRRIFHSAFEQMFRVRTLDAIALHSSHEHKITSRPRFQATFCLDDREESFRRHLEEIAPDVETFGAAGFFNVVMYYKGAADAHFTALCPIVVRPQHWVVEEVGSAMDKVSRLRARTRRVLGTASHKFHVGSRSAALGAVLTGALGVFASFPLVARILFPRVAARIRGSLAKFVRTPPMTHLHLERTDPVAGPTGDHAGFNLTEMSASSERLLREIGLVKNFARLILVVGHRSNSQNNPYNSAYNCGACGGGNGGANGRAMAQILNDPRVRRNLSEHGLEIPAETVFVGGVHNTCDDSVTFFDITRIPESHRDDFAEAQRNIEEACARNAHERCRRFMSAPLTLTFAQAKAHVEERSEDLAQTRPELGHATNAITIVGRRSWSRGLFLDRRAFLTSYDPTTDNAESTILLGILGPAFNVCSGINHEYNFSHVDNVVIGSGSKLPHNLAALVGVMDGAASDLRSGMPWQMVEIHEPLRSLFVIETTAERMITVMDRNPLIAKLCRNEWAQLALLHPDTREITYFQGGEFIPHRTRATALPRVESSVEWYRGWRDHLDFAEIVPASLATI